MILIPKDQINDYSDYFSDHLHLRNVLKGELTENLGNLYVDQIKNTTLLFYEIHIGAWFITGNLQEQSFQEMGKYIKFPTVFVLEDNSQEKILESFFKEVRRLERVNFSSENLSIEKLTELLIEIPEFYEIKPIDIDTGLKIDSANYPTEHKEKYINGISYCLTYENDIVGYATSTESFNYEIDVWIHKDHRRKGLATLLCTKLIKECLKKGIKPHWDAANQNSVLLAKKLGFTDPETYHIYYVQWTN